MIELYVRMINRNLIRLDDIPEAYRAGVEERIEPVPVENTVK